MHLEYYVHPFPILKEVEQSRHHMFVLMIPYLWKLTNGLANNSRRWKGILKCTRSIRKYPPSCPLWQNLKWDGPLDSWISIYQAFALDIGTNRCQCCFKKKQTNYKTEEKGWVVGVRRGAYGCVKILFHFLDIFSCHAVSDHTYGTNERTIPLKAASFCSLTADAFSSTDGIQKSFFGSTCIKESRTTFLHNIILALGNANHMNRKEGTLEAFIGMKSNN